MDLFETQPTTTSVEAPRSSTISALVLLAVFAVILSYLIAYAGANALASAEVIPQWSRGTDPRPRWFGNTFAILMGGFIFIGGVARFLSWRQLRTIDQMQDGL
jgi:hypothetical protein